MKFGPLKAWGVALVAMLGMSVNAQTPIRIGEINSYSAIPQFTQPYKPVSYTHLTLPTSDLV